MAALPLLHASSLQVPEELLPKPAAAASGSDAASAEGSDARSMTAEDWQRAGGKPPKKKKLSKVVLGTFTESGRLRDRATIEVERRQELAKEYVVMPS